MLVCRSSERGRREKAAGHSLVVQDGCHFPRDAEGTFGISAGRFLAQLDEGELGGAVDSHTPTRDRSLS